VAQLKASNEKLAAIAAKIEGLEKGGIHDSAKREWRDQEGGAGTMSW
jgi:hypothetical protein